MNELDVVGPRVQGRCEAQFYAYTLGQCFHQFVMELGAIVGDDDFGHLMQSEENSID